MMISAVRSVKVTVGRMKVTVHAVQVAVFPCLSRRVVPAAVVSAVGGVEAGIGSVEGPVRAVVLPVGRRPRRMLGLRRRWQRQQDKRGGGGRQK